MIDKKTRLLAVVAVVLALIALAVGYVYPQAQEADLLLATASGDSNFTNVVASGDVTAGDTFYGASAMIFEGATADDYETSFAITDPTADRTFTFPDSSGTLAVNPAAESIVFEGATADDYETTLAVVDPTADRTVTVPNETGAVMVSSLATNGTAITNSVTGGTNVLVWEGATADDYETSVSATDPTADRSVVLPDAGGTVMLSSLATNGADAANAVTGASNALVFEGATANNYETSIAPTDPTADRTVTLQDATGTVALTSQAADMSITAVADGGNAGVKNEYSGLPRIKLVGGAQGTNPAAQTLSLVDDSATGEYAPVDADVTEAEGSVAGIYKFGASSYAATFAVTAAEDDGFVDAALGGAASWEDMESIGAWVYVTATLAAADLQWVLTDDGGAQKFDFCAITSANVWTWCEVDISALNGGTGDVISDVALTLTATGETNLGAFTIYLDQAWVWDAADEEALGTAVIQDGVLSVLDTEGGASLTEGTDYIVHYESGNDFIVYVTDQSTADIAVLVAY